MAPTPSPVSISCYSDILCIWAYIAERRLDELHEVFSDQIALDFHFTPLFGDTNEKFRAGWKDKGGFNGYADHVRQVAGNFDHITLHPDVWSKVRPASSAGVHLILKAVQLVSQDPAKTLETAKAFRRFFFEEGQDIAQSSIQQSVLQDIGIDTAELTEVLDNGTAFAKLCRDSELQQVHKIEGSPTYLLNNGRQKLYGNVGFKIIEANILELLKEPNAELASWC